MRNEPFIQYVYHFQHPVNSIDVRKISEEELQFCLSSYRLELYAGCKSIHFKSAEKLLRDHFPEHII